jgi:hypothetical protein
MLGAVGLEGIRVGGRGSLRTTPSPCLRAMAGHRWTSRHALTWRPFYHPTHAHTHVHTHTHTQDGKRMVTLIPGDGIGPEISESVKRIFTADKVPPLPYPPLGGITWRRCSNDNPHTCHLPHTHTHAHPLASRRCPLHGRRWTSPRCWWMARPASPPPPSTPSTATRWP